MKYKCWCVFFASLLLFACNNASNNNVPGGGVLEDSSSSEGYEYLSSSSASEPNIGFSSSSAIAVPSSSSGGVSSSLATSSGSSNSNGSNGSSSSANASSSSNGVSSSANNASSSSNGASSSTNTNSVSSSSRGASSNSISSSSSTVVAGSSGSLSYGTRFTPEMLGLTPGATTANLNLNWISTSTNCSSSSTDDGKTLVRLFNASGSLVNTFTGTTAKGPSGKCVHKATITGITPATSYKYSVSNNDKDWSNDYSYKSPPSGNVFTFAVVADPQITDGAQDNNTKPKASPSTTAQGWADVVKKITETDATFIVSAGDQVDSYTYSPSQYTKFFAPEGLRSLPFAPVIGNHDGHQEYMHHFNMPNVSNSQPYGVYTGVAGNYYYLYNNILFVAFNTGYAPKDLAAAKTSMAEYEKVIKAAKAAHSGYDWLIVQHHKSTTSISSHACDMEIQYYIDAGFEKLITDEGVDVVISGHDHIHVRSHLMKWDNAKKYSVRSTDKGTIYLTLTTASGVKFYPPFPFSNSTMYEAIVNGEFAATAGYSQEHPVLADLTRGLDAFRKTTSDTKDKWPISTDFCVPTTRTNYLPNYTPNYTIFKVNGKTISATTYTSENVKVDEFTLTPKGR